MSNKNIKQVIEDSLQTKIIIEEMRFSCKAVCVFLCSLQAFSDMLRENKTLRSLNLESNFITGAGVQALVEALRDNDTLSEIKIDNQVPPHGHNHILF